MTDAKKKPGAVRQAVTLLVAMGILIAAAVVIYPKFQSRTEGPVRLDILNASEASMIDPSVSLRVPADQTVGALRSVISAGFLVTAYEGMGPVEIESVTFTAGEDGQPVTHEIDQTLEPGGVMVLRITADSVEVDASELAPETP
ncbi:MAG: hypothetical protein NCW75_04600 [Phycisphaera sp.]|nr:MAG: hypothetical protein NCW75_04600 [Phycisphaera sp.]